MSGYCYRFHMFRFRMHDDMQLIQVKLLKDQMESVSVETLSS